MKTGIILTALGCCISFFALPVQAAEQTVCIETVCPDFEPLSEDIIRFSGLENNRVQIRIVQHSPERENLLLYDTELQSEPEHNYIFRAEPGDYTITVSTPTVSGGAAVSTYTQKFTIDNADFSDAPQYEKTEVCFTGSYLQAKDTEIAAPEQLSANTEYADGVKQQAAEIGFPRYQRIRGDFDGDGTVDVSDAQQTLNAYAELLSDKPAEIVPAASAACDISGDGRLDAEDAQAILLYYSETLAGNTPHWQDGKSSLQ